VFYVFISNHEMVSDLKFRLIHDIKR
jgi:hypothetical protein